MKEPGRSARILVVDDEPGMRWILEKLLGQAGFEVVMAGAPGEALDRAARERFDVIVIDYRLPEETGLTLFRKLREISPGSRGILLTAYGSDALTEEAQREGFSACLNKPFRNEDIIEEICKAAAMAAVVERVAPTAD